MLEQALSRLPAPYYDAHGITIYLADNRQILPLLDGADIDLIFTSPPYNMGLSPGGNGRGIYRPGGNPATRQGARFRNGYGEHDDAMPWDQYNAWQRALLNQCWSLLSPRGAIYYNCRYRVEHGRARLPLDMDFGPLPRNFITWDRGTGIGVNLRHYCAVAEWIVTFPREDFKLTDLAASGRGDVWRYGMAREDYGHPAPFPVALPARAILDVGPRSLLDPHMGSGTSLVAARSAGIRGIGIDNDEHWCEVAATRLSQGVLFS